MKLKLILVAGALLGVAYLVGCGGGGNNNNNSQSCAAGLTWNGSSCVVAATGVGNCQAQPGTIWAQQANACVAVCTMPGGGNGGMINGSCQFVASNCGQNGYQNGYQGGYQGGYQNGYQNGYGYQNGGQGCNGFQNGGYYPSGYQGGQWGPYPIQQYPYYYNPNLYRQNTFYIGMSYQ